MAAFEGDPASVYGVVGTFFHGLARAGVEHVVVSPGSRSTPLTITARHTPGLRTWVELDERSGGFFALGLAKATGRPVVLVCTSGTAAANYLPAVVEAHYARVPLIVATTDRPAELRDWGAGQTIDQVGLYGRYVRWASEVPVPAAGSEARAHAAQLAARAVREATGTSAGAVHLNWPLREPLPPPVGQLRSILDEASEETAVPAMTRGTSLPARDVVEELAGLAHGTERGLLWVGPLETDASLRSAIARFARASGWPVLADPASNLRAGPELRGAPILAAGDLLARSPRFTEGHPPEAVIRLGDAPVSKAQRLWIEAAAPTAFVWLDQGGQWGDASRLATRVIAGDAATLLEGAAADLALPPDPCAGQERDWCRTLVEADRNAGAAVAAALAQPDALGGPDVAEAVARLAPEGTQLFASNSMSIRLLDLAFARRDAALRVLCSRGAAGIDGINSTALGAAASGRPTLLLTGDLAFLHDLPGLLLARRERLPLTIVVLDDDGGGIFSMLPVASQGDDVAFHELFHTPHGLDLSAVAAGLALPCTRVGDRSELDAAIRAGIETEGVSIVHVPVDAKANEARFRSVLAAGRDAVDAAGLSGDSA